MIQATDAVSSYRGLSLCISWDELPLPNYAEAPSALTAYYLLVSVEEGVRKTNYRVTVKQGDGRALAPGTCPIVM